MMNKVVTFGEIMLRLGAPDYLRLVQSHQLDVSFAGAEANVAVSLSNYGIPTDYITCLPQNPMAEKCLRELRSYQVGTSHVQRGGKRMGILFWRLEVMYVHRKYTMTVTILLLPQ